MPNYNEKGRQYNNGKPRLWDKYNLRWVVIVSVWTFILTILISIVAEVIFINTRLIIPFFILIIIILTGVIFDIIGISITVASDKPFHAMAADKVQGAMYAIKLLKNAGAVSNFCNDVIGDICGIVSGAAGINIVLQLSELAFLSNRTIMTIIISSFIAALTVGGKAIGKHIAIIQAHNIVFSTAKLLNFIDVKFRLNIFSRFNKN